MKRQSWLLIIAAWLLLSLTAQAAPLADPCTVAGGASSCSPTELTFSQLLLLIWNRSWLGLPVYEQWTALHLKLSLPSATFFTTLLVAPLALLVSRLGASVSTAISIALVFLWYVLYSIFGPLGRTGAVDPFLAAWIQNLLFAGVGIGIWLYLGRDRLVFWRR